MNLLLYFFGRIPFALAQSFIPEGGGGCDLANGNIDADCIPDFIAHIIATIFGFTGGVFLILVILSGYKIAIGSVTGSDSSKGKEMLKQSIFGFILCALTWFIIDFFISVLAG